MTDWKAKYEDLNRRHENYASELAKNKTLLEQVECLKQVEVDHEESKRIITAVIEAMNERKNDLWSGAEMFINQSTVENQLLNVIGRCANMQVEFDRLRECTAFETGGYIELMNAAIGAMQHGQDGNMRAALASADAELVELRKQHEELRQCLGDANKAINGHDAIQSWNQGIVDASCDLLDCIDSDVAGEIKALKSKATEAQAQLNAICKLIDAEPEEGEPIESIRLAVKAMNGWEGHCDHWHEDIAQLVEYVDAFMNHCPEDLEPEGVREHWEWLNERNELLRSSLAKHRCVVRSVAHLVGMEKVTHASSEEDHVVCDYEDMLERLRAMVNDNKTLEEYRATRRLIHAATKLKGASVDEVAEEAIKAIETLDSIGRAVEEEDRSLIYATVTGQQQYVAELETENGELLECLKYHRGQVLTACRAALVSPYKTNSSSLDWRVCTAGVFNKVLARIEDANPAKMEQRIADYDSNLETALITLAERAKEIIKLKDDLGNANSDTRFLTNELRDSRESHEATKAELRVTEAQANAWREAHAVQAGILGGQR